MYCDPTIVEAFTRIARLKPEKAHPNHVKAFTEGLSKAQKAPGPGVVGGGYQPGGVVFVARNGALGTSPQHQMQDQKSARLWSRLARVAKEQRPRAYTALMQQLDQDVRTWNIFRYIDAFTKKARIPADAHALVNLVAFRSKFANINDLGPTCYEEAYRSYTGRLLKALDPVVIVPLGNDQAKELRRLYEGSSRITPQIRRTIGDRSEPKTLDEDVAAAVRIYRQELKKRSPTSSPVPS